MVGSGGVGFIGSHLVDWLMDEGFEVVVLDDFSSGRRENLNQHFGKANFCWLRVMFGIGLMLRRL